MTALTLDLVKAFLRYESDNTDEDMTLAVALQAGIGWVEQYTGRSIAGVDPDTIPAGLLHGVLLYAGMFDRLRDGGGERTRYGGDQSGLLDPVMAVCFPYRSVLL